MLCGRLRCEIVFVEEARLPPDLAYHLRTVFGRALRRVVCCTPREDCPNCLLVRRCLYPQFFPPRPVPGSRPVPRGRRDGTPPDSQPLPYVIETPATVPALLPRESPFSFHLVLFGRVNDSLPPLIRGLEQTGHLGLGRGKERGRFVLSAVRSKEEVVYPLPGEEKTGDHRPVNLKKELMTAVRSSLIMPSETATVRLLTPLVLGGGETRQPRLPFPVLIREAAHRIASLCRAYGMGKPPLDYRGLMIRARQVAVASSRLEFDGPSGRQQAGLVGEVTYRGELAEFLPLLRFCVETHLGRNTVVGMGRIAVVTDGEGP